MDVELPEEESKNEGHDADSHGVAQVAAVGLVVHAGVSQEAGHERDRDQKESEQKLVDGGVAHG